jgi:hypothetical protein
MASKVWALVLLGLLALVSQGSTAAIPSSTTASSTSTTTEGPEDSILSLRMAMVQQDDALEKKNAGFYACCKKNAIFQSEEDTKHACTYSDDSGTDMLPVVKSLPKQKQSDLAKCFADSQDDTSCCSEGGVRWALLDSVQ